ncbi:MAG: phytoene/squalene synthase family protein, partial [Planctomycetia bacterium]
MTSTLEADHRVCAEVLARSGSNFALPIRLLPGAKRRGTTALYAFCRRADDTVDDAGDPAAAGRALDRLEADLERAVAGGTSDDPVIRALVDTVRRFAVPEEHLFEIIAGVRMDLDHDRYATFSDLRLYCHRVASAVGLAAIHIWGFRDPRAALPAADACGIAFQLTNILRDVPEDLGRGRIYLPLEDFAAADCRPEDLEVGRIGTGFERLLAINLARAAEHYRMAEQLDRHLSTDGRIVF